MGVDVLVLFGCSYFGGVNWMYLVVSFSCVAVPDGVACKVTEIIIKKHLGLAFFFYIFACLVQRLLFFRFFLFFFLCKFLFCFHAFFVHTFLHL